MTTLKQMLLISSIKLTAQTKWKSLTESIKKISGFQNDEGFYNI